ncbi:MAG: hypothetical protein Q9165_002394 [Trypethelium subeluteriae]
MPSLYADLCRPDNCDGTFESNCDPKRAYRNIVQTLEEGDAKNDTMSFMGTYWKESGGHDASFYQHEWSKHGTCFSTLQPRCYSAYRPQEEVVIYFEKTIELFKTLPSYKWLSDAGITPSNGKTYDRTAVQAALEKGFGHPVTIKCHFGELDEIWYHFNIKGSFDTGQSGGVDNFIPSDPQGGQQKGFLISNGKLAVEGQPAKYRTKWNEVNSDMQNGDRLVYATLESIRANLDSTLRKLMRFFINHARGLTVSSQAAGYSMQQRLLLMSDDLSMNTHDLLAYHTRLRDRFGQTNRNPLGPTQRHNVPSRLHDIRVPMWAQNSINPPADRVPERSSQSKTLHRDQSVVFRRDTEGTREMPSQWTSSWHGNLPLRRGTPYPEENGRVRSRAQQQDPPRPSSAQLSQPFNAPLRNAMHSHDHRRQDQPRRPNSTEPTGLRRPHGRQHSGSDVEAGAGIGNSSRLRSHSQAQKTSGPVSVLFVDSFNGTRSILAHACAETLRLWTLDNGAASPFCALDSAATRLRSSLIRDTTIHGWTLHHATDARINHAALRTLFRHADTYEESDIGTRISKHEPRGLVASDFEDFDFLLTLDQRNFARLCHLRDLVPTSRARIFLLDNIQAPTSPPEGHPLYRTRDSTEVERYGSAANYEPLITTLQAALVAFLTAHTTWQPPEHPPFSYRYTPFRSRQFVAPVGIHEPTERRIEDLRRGTGCEIWIDRVILGGEGERRVRVVTVTGREEALRDEWEVVMRELGGWF